LVKDKQEQLGAEDPIRKRLDALIRVFVEVNRSDGKRKFTDGSVARILQSVGLTPTEIARILGKKSRADISKYLYTKKTKPE
jgi:hypothetical protein